jgi:hypothetical protein
MPSEPRKLPVIYVPTIDGAPDFDTQECDDGQTESLIVAFASERYIDRYNTEREEAGFCPVVMAPYEPAVPRCNTCELFAQPNFCGRGFGESRNTTPDDYCSNHSDLTK